MPDSSGSGAVTGAAPTSTTYDHALQHSERLGDHAGTARGYHQVGVIAPLRGDYDAAQGTGNAAALIAALDKIARRQAEGDSEDPPSDEPSGG